jgi:hypothetical protein
MFSIYKKVTYSKNILIKRFLIYKKVSKFHYKIKNIKKYNNIFIKKLAYFYIYIKKL